jgi:hypothetical protein
MNGLVRHYGQLSWRALRILVTSTDSVLTVIGVGLFFIMLFNPELVGQITARAGAEWERRVLRVSRWWSLVIPGALFFHAIVKASYLIVREAQERAASAETSPQNRAARTLDARQRMALKEKLGAALAEGEALYGRGVKEEAEAWATKTQKTITQGLGAAEAALFLSDAGYTFYSGSGPVKNWLQGRLQRLTELLARLDTVPLRDDFDPNPID